MDLINKVNQKNKGLTTEKILQDGLTEGTIRPELAQKFRELGKVLETIGEPKTLDALENPLLAFEEANYADKKLEEDEIFYINSTSSTIRSFTKHLNEMRPVQQKDNLKNNPLQTRDACVFGRNLGCFGNALIQAGVGGVTGAVAHKITGAEGSTFTAGKAGFVVGLITGIVAVFTDNSCKCGETVACFMPDVFNPIIDNNSICNPNIGFAITGPGTVPTIFRWSAFRKLANGQEIAISDVQNKPTSGPALAPFPIPDPNETIILKVEIPTCGSVSTLHEFSFKLSDLLGSPGGVIITGSSDVGLFEQATYLLSGECLINPNNQMQWFIPSQGTLQSGGGSSRSSATIQWITRTCASGSYGGYCFRPSVSVRSTNPCTNTQNSGGLGVAVH
jgi:hypothetical protein